MRKKIKDENDKKYKIDRNNVYLMKYRLNNFAYFFILSNKKIQIDFFDKIKIIFSLGDTKKITYIN